MDVDRRPATETDFHFLYELHKSALGPYVEATWGWDEVFQRRWFEERFDPEANEVILVDGAPAGCLRIREEPDRIELDYIALLPERRRLLCEASATRRAPGGRGGPAAKGYPA